MKQIRSPVTVKHAMQHVFISLQVRGLWLHCAKFYTVQKAV